MQVFVPMCSCMQVHTDIYHLIDLTDIFYMIKKGILLMRSINLLAECKFEMVKTNVKKFMKKQLRKTFRDKKRLEKGVNICIYVNKRRKL